jgi:LysM repeat protein
MGVVKMYNVYRVGLEDTMDSIARMYGTTVENLMDLNNLNENSLRAGDEIIVPDTSKKYFEYYKVNKGDSIYAIAKKYNINPELLEALNGINANDYIYPNQTILIPKSNYSYYITKSGDTLDSVINVLGVTRDKFLKDNNIIYLLEGQMLVKEKN